MPATTVLVVHDDGRWYRAQLLGHHRDRASGAWRVGVRYYVDVGMQHQRVVWADECRAVDDPPPGWADPRQDVRTRPAPLVTPAGTATRPENTWLW